jgi:hypothetical protein
MTTRPEAPNPARAPGVINETDPRAADFEVLAPVPDVAAASTMPEGVDPSVKEVPHWDWSEEEASEVREGIAELMTL